MNREDREIEVDLLQLCKVVLAKTKYILLVAVIFGICGFAGSKMLLKPVYEASLKMIVITQGENEGVVNGVSNDRLNSAKSLVDTYAILIKNSSLMKQIVDELKLPMTSAQLSSCITVKSVNRTEVMQVSVRHADKECAYSIAEKIEQYAGAHFDKTYGVGAAKIVESASAKNYPISPNNKTNAIMAALIGVFLSCGLFVVLYLMDNTYKTNTDIQNDLDIPLLGMIPKVECCGKYSRYGYKYGYGYGYGQTNQTENLTQKGKCSQKGKFAQKEK